MINAQMMPSMLPMGGGFTYEEVQSLPAMTGNTAPAGHVASASSTFDSGYWPWKAFDQLEESNNVWATLEFQTANSWLRRQTPEPIRVWKYRVTWQPPAGPGSAPRNFSLQGSNNGSTWVTLNSQTAVTSWTAGVPKEFEIGLAPDPYLYHQLFIATNDGSTVVVVGELELLQAL